MYQLVKRHQKQSAEEEETHEQLAQVRLHVSPRIHLHHVLLWLHLYHVLPRLHLYHVLLDYFCVHFGPFWSIIVVSQYIFIVNSLI